MKTILKIIVILLIASVVAGAFSFAVNHTSITSGPGEGGQPPAMPNSNGQSFQPMGRPDGGDRQGGSIAGGLGGVLATLAKLTGITFLVVLVQKAFRLLGNRKLMSTYQ